MKEMTLREMGDQLREAFASLPKSKRANTFEQMMRLVHYPVGKLPKVKA